MIVVYNFSGLFTLLAAIAAFALVMGATGRGAFGLAAAAVVMILSVTWRRASADPRGRGSWPALFFIPLWILGIPLLLLSFPLFCVEQFKGINPDPRQALLKADESTLRDLSTSGNAALSSSIRASLQEIAIKEAKIEDAHVFTRVRGDAVLVLIQMANLKQFENTARDELLDAIQLIVMTEDGLLDKEVYIGVRGSIAYGAIRAPGGTSKTGAVVSSAPLLAFYNSAPTSSPAATTSPTTGETTTLKVGKVRSDSR